MGKKATLRKGTTNFSGMLGEAQVGLPVDPTGHGPLLGGKPNKGSKTKGKEVVILASPLSGVTYVGREPRHPRALLLPVAKKVSTLESADKLRYTDEELEEFRGIINKKLDEAREDHQLLLRALAEGERDPHRGFLTVEDGQETLSREENSQLASRQEKFIKHLEDALLRIRNKTYGICRVTGRLISKERLRLVPHATLSVEAKVEQGA